MAATASPIYVLLAIRKALPKLQIELQDLFRPRALSYDRLF